MIAGIFLNSVVIISLWRSQIGKKPCYFMIRILSCFDLLVVTVTHPLLLLSTITMYLGDVSAADFFHGGIVCSKYRAIPCNNLSVFLQESCHKTKAFILSASLDVSKDC